MKKSIAFVMLLTFSAVVFSEVIIPKLPTSDIEGGEDHPLLKRYADSHIVVYQHKNFDEFTLSISGLNAILPDTTGY